MQASRNNVERVEEIWKEMKTYGIKPDVISYGTLMKANTDDAERVEELWKEMIENGIKPDAAAHTTRKQATRNRN